MPVKFITQEQVALYAQKSGLGTTARPLSVSGSEFNRHGLGDMTLTRPGREVVFGGDANGAFRIKISPKTAPGGIHTGSVEVDDINAIDYLQRKSDDQMKFILQRRYFDCDRLDVSTSWERIEHWPEMTVTEETVGGGPSREASGAAISRTFNVAFEEQIILLRSTLASQTQVETEDILSIAHLDFVPDCVPGFPGADNILFFGADDDTIAAGEVTYTTNGGSAIAAFATDPTPFAEIIGITAMVCIPISKTQYRLICGSQAIAGSAARLAYADFNFGDTTLDVSSWTTTTIADAADPDGVTAMVANSPTEIYIATAQAATDVGIYLSTDFAATDPGTAIYEGTDDINQLHAGPTGQIWAAGNTDLVLRGDCNGFTVITGPGAGSNNNTAIAEASNGVVYCANLQSIYRSLNVDTGTWESKKDFGSSRVVKHIHCAKHDSEVVLVVVDNTTPGDGELWLTADGGATWEQVPVLSSPNAGYNAAYFSRNGLDDGNLGFIVGDDDALGVVHKLTPPSVGC